MDWQLAHLSDSLSSDHLWIPSKLEGRQVPSVLGNYPDLIYYLTQFIFCRLDQHLPFLGGKKPALGWVCSFLFLSMNSVQTACLFSVWSSSVGSRREHHQDSLLFLSAILCTWGGVATGFSHSSSCEQNLHIFSLLAGRYFSNYFYYFFLSVMLRLKPRACYVLSKCSVLSYSACPQVTITFNFYI